MRFKQWFYEAVEYPHENFQQFYRKWKNQTARLAKILKKEYIEDIIRNVEKFKRNEEFYCYGFLGNWAEATVDLLKAYQDAIERTYGSSLIDDAEFVINSDFYKNMERLKDVGTTLTHYRRFLSLDRTWYNYQEAYDDLMRSFEGQEPSEYIRNYCGEETSSAFTQAMQKSNDFFAQIDKIVAQIKRFDSEIRIKADQNQRQQLKYYKGSSASMQELMPPHEPFEILYHASSNVPAVLREGFKTRKQLGNKTGLGGGPDDIISFTANPRIAKSIASAIKTAVKIAKGIITFDDIVKKYKRFGIIDDNDIETQKRSTSDAKENAFNLFRLANMKLEGKGLGYDPYFGFPAFKKFAETNLDDIGVLQAKVDMSKVKEFVPREQEYRVPVDAISDISVYQ